MKEVPLTVSTILISPPPTPTDRVLAQAVLHLFDRLIRYQEIRLILHTDHEQAQPQSFATTRVQYSSLEDGAAYISLLDAAVLIAGTPFAVNLLSSLICRNRLSETPLLLLGYTNTQLRWLMELLHIDELPETVWCVELDQPERSGDRNIDGCTRTNTRRLTSQLDQFLACLTAGEQADLPLPY